ncbi:hypothetical protein B6V01_000840 [Methanosarcinales archaeon ex4572_44]|nr:MAG: hypothetical protein B6V01_000840 [Methanosarcinales archaeon ex4572_44]RLG25497.1 MAG: hypothetical protein DRN85_05775 [Methanosarcinales archaeon]
MIVVQQYQLKRGVSKDIERVKRVFVECFDGVEPKCIDGRYTASFEALESINFWFEDGKLCVDTITRPNPCDDEILETNRRFRKFLEQATGYTAKERVKKSKKSVSK